MTGFGRYIQDARLAAGLTPAELAERMGRTKNIVYRLEAEDQEPTSDQINALVSVLHISTEELLRKMGVNISPPAAARLPRTLVDDLLALDAEQMEVAMRLAHALRHSHAAPSARP